MRGIKRSQTTRAGTPGTRRRLGRTRDLHAAGARGLALLVSAGAVIWGVTSLGADAIGRAKASEFVGTSETMDYVAENFNPELIGEETVSEEVVDEKVVEEEIEVTVDDAGNMWDQHGNRIDEDGNVLDADGNVVENTEENVVDNVEYREMEAPTLTQTHLYVRTKYTYVDGTVPVGDGRRVYDLTSIDEFFSMPAEVKKAFNASLTGFATLYDGASEDYYVMLVNAAAQNGTAGKVIGVDVVQNNDFGEVVEGVVYDPETGLAYIPKSTTFSENSIEDGVFIQSQVMIAIEGTDLPESVLNAESISVRSDVRAVGKTTLKGGGWLDTVEVPVVDPEDAGKVRLSDLSVYVDGVTEPIDIVEGETAWYDDETGTLELSVDAQTITGIKVVIGGTLLDNLMPVAHAALTPQNMKKYPYGKLTASATAALAAKEGQTMTYTGWVCHYWNPPSGPKYRATGPGGHTAWPWHWDQNDNALYFSSSNPDWTAIGESDNPLQKSWSWLSKNLRLAQGYWFMMEMPISTKLQGITDANGNKTVPLKNYQNTEVRVKKVQAMAPATCNHLTMSTLKPYRDYFQTKIDMKVLKVDLTGKKPGIVVAFHAREGTQGPENGHAITQEATAVYCFNVESVLSRVQVRKVNKSTGADIPKKGFTFALRAADTTKDLATVTTGDDGTGEFNKDLGEGTYWVVETGTPPGFTAPDQSVHATVNVHANGSGGTKRSSDNKYVYTVSYKDYPCAYINVVKKNSNGTTIPLAGFQFKVAGQRVSGNSASSFETTITTNSSGVASCDVPLLVPSTVTVTETYAVEPFMKDSTPKTINLYTTDSVGNARFEYNGQSIACAARNGVNNLATIDPRDNQHGHIEVVKLNAKTGQPVTIKDGFQFTLYQSDGRTAIESANTAADGIARFQTSCAVPGTYVVKETSATKPFYLSEATHTVKLQASGTRGDIVGGIADDQIHSGTTCASVKNVYQVRDSSMANYPWAMVKVQKLSKQILPQGVDAAAVKMSGFEFRLTGTGFKNQPIDERAVTDSNGVAKFTSKLLVGNSYVLQETVAKEPFVRTMKKITITPTARDSVGNIVGGVADSSMTGCDKENVLFVKHADLANDQYGFIEVQKLNKATGNPVRKRGFSFSLSGKDINGNDFKDTVETDDDGIARFKRRICVGSPYQIQEQSVIEPFRLNSTVVTVTPKAQGTAGAVENGIADDAIGDLPTRGVKNVLLVSDPNNANEQYGYIKIFKRNIETQQTIPLANVTFDVYRDDGTKLASAVTEGDGMVVVPDTNGKPYRFDVLSAAGTTYTVRETGVPIPYNRKTADITVTLKPSDDLGNLQGGHTEPGVTEMACVVDSICDDAPQYGRATITKMDTDDKTLLPEASYKVFALNDVEYVGQGDATRDPSKSCGYPVAQTTLLKSGGVDFNRNNGTVTVTNPVVFVNADGSTFDTITTGSDGTATTGWLPIDESGSSSYAFVEVDNSNGRLIDGMPIKFDLVYDGQLVDKQTTATTAMQEDEPNDVTFHKVALADGSVIDDVVIGFWKQSDDVQHRLSQAPDAPTGTDTYVLRTPDDQIVPKAYRRLRGVAVDATAVVSETRAIRLALADNEEESILLSMDSAIATNLTPGSYVATLVDQAGSPVGGSSGVLRFEAKEADEVTIAIGYEGGSSSSSSDNGSGTGDDQGGQGAGDDQGGSDNQGDSGDQGDGGDQQGDGNGDNGGQGGGSTSDRPLSMRTIVAPAERRSATFSWSEELSAWVATDLQPASTYQIEIDRKVVKVIDTSPDGGAYWLGRYATEANGLFAAGYLDQAALPANDSMIIHESDLYGTEYPYESATDENGDILVRRLGTGTYVVAELLPPTDETGHRSFLVDRSFHVIDIDGTTGYIKVLNQTDAEGNPTDTYERSKVLGFRDDVTKLDISKREVSDGEEIAGAELVLTDVSTNDEIERWISTTTPHRISGLIPGRYRLTEYLTPKDYDKAESIEFTVLPTGVSQHQIMLDSPISIDTEIDKRQEIAKSLDERDDPNDEENNAKAQENLVGDYEYSVDFRSNSNTWTDEFTVEDPLEPANDGLAHLVSLTTPQAWQDYDGKLNVWYRTNKTPVDYKDLSTEPVDDGSGKGDSEKEQSGDATDAGDSGTGTGTDPGTTNDGTGTGTGTDGTGTGTGTETGDNGTGTGSGSGTGTDGTGTGTGTDGTGTDGTGTDGTGTGTGTEEGSASDPSGQGEEPAAEEDNPRPWIRFAANATLSDGHVNSWLHDDNAMAADIDGDCRIIDYVGWKLWKADLSATVSTTLDVSDLNLDADEYVTGVRFEYGRVEVGFTTRTEDWDRELLKQLHDDLDEIDVTNRGTFADHDDAVKAAITRLGSELELFQTELSKEHEEAVKEADEKTAEDKEKLAEEIEAYNKALANLADTQGKLRRFMETDLVPAYEGDPETDESLMALNEATEAAKLAIRSAIDLPGAEEGALQDAREAVLKAVEEMHSDVNGTIDPEISAALRKAIDAYADEMARIPEDGGAHDMDEATAHLTQAIMSALDGIKAVALAGRVPYAPAVLSMRLTDKYITGTELRNSAKVDAYRNGGNDLVEEFRTTLTNKDDGTHVIDPTGTAKVVDRVSYRGLTPGETYVMTGTLHLRKDGQDAGAIEDGGKPVTATAEFVPEEVTGSVELEFEFDASLIADGAAVAFERCELAADGTLVGLHENINDENQTVVPDDNPDAPKIRTSLTNKADGTHEVAESGEVTVVDTVTYRNLVPGTEYAMTGTIHVRKAGTDAGILMHGGEAVAVTQKFTPTAADGTVELEFTFDVEDLKGGRAVAFESCEVVPTEEIVTNTVVATHEDIDDEGQTVTPKGTPDDAPKELTVNKLEGHDRDEVMQRPRKHVYEIGTYLATVAGDKQIEIDGSEPVTLIDHVAYSGLIPGHEYELQAELHIQLNNTDGGIIQGSKATKRFVPTTPDGTAEVPITVPRGEMPLAPWVAFEELHKIIPETGESSDYVLANHMDITDADQTVATSEVAEDLIQLGGILTGLVIASVAATASLVAAVAISRKRRDA